MCHFIFSIAILYFILKAESGVKHHKQNQTNQTTMYSKWFFITKTIFLLSIYSQLIIISIINNKYLKEMNNIDTNSEIGNELERRLSLYRHINHQQQCSACRHLLP